MDAQAVAEDMAIVPSDVTPDDEAIKEPFPSPPSMSFASISSDSTDYRPEGYFYDETQDRHAAEYWSHFRDPHVLAAQHVPNDGSCAAASRAYREYRDKVRKPVLATYTILGFLSSGTYGRVYKARLRSAPAPPPSLNLSSMTMNRSFSKNQPFPGEQGTPQSDVAMSPINVASTGGSRTTTNSDSQIYAIKKFKPDSKETDSSIYTGISQSATREISLNRELRHTNIVTLHQVMLEEKAIYMVFEYAEHDLLQIIHHHSTVLRTPISTPVLKSILWQLINGTAYLHANWVLHRDLKPANILVTSQGVVKIGDLGLARLYSAPLQSLYSGDKVVVTIWYRAPELLLGARHYTTAIDMWSLGCIWGELLALRPIFKGEEAKMDPKTKAAPFQTDQLKRIVEVLGTPNKDRWGAIESMPDYKGWWPHLRLDNYPKTLSRWYTSRNKSEDGYELFDSLLQYDPQKRLTAQQALHHPWFTQMEPKPTKNAFVSLAKPTGTYPNRRVIHDDQDPKMRSNYLPPIDSHHLPHAQAKAPQYLQHTSSLRNVSSVMGSQGAKHTSSIYNNPGSAQPASTTLQVSAIGGPAAPPPITIGTGSALPIPFNESTASNGPPTAPAPGTVHSVQSIASSTDPLENPPSAASTTTAHHTTGTATNKNMVATATRNQQRKRQKI